MAIDRSDSIDRYSGNVVVVVDSTTIVNQPICCRGTIGLRVNRQFHDSADGGDASAIVSDLFRPVDNRRIVRVRGIRN